MLPLQACAACSESKRDQQLSQPKTVLKSLLTDTNLLQFAAADSHGVLACISLSKQLKGPIAAFICQAKASLLDVISVAVADDLLPCLAVKFAPHAHACHSLKQYLQEVLQLFVDKFSRLLSTTNPAIRAKGFTGCLHSVYQQVPQQIARAIASKLAPMQLLWVIVAQAGALLR